MTVARRRKRHRANKKEGGTWGRPGACGGMTLSAPRRGLQVHAAPLSVSLVNLSNKGAPHASARRYGADILPVSRPSASGRAIKSGKNVKIIPPRGSADVRIPCVSLVEPQFSPARTPEPPSASRRSRSPVHDEV
jgi:hypothetical protein